MINRSQAPRTDLPYLRRRIKAAPLTAAPSVPQNATGTSASPAHGLNLSRSTLPLAPSQVSIPASGGLSLSRPAEPAPKQPQAQMPPPARVTPSAALTLGGGGPASSANARSQKLAAQREGAKAMAREVELLFPAPRIHDLYELNLQDRVLRLTALESSVGTLVISGSTAIAWESVRRVVGGADVAGHTVGSPVLTAGNRALVAYDANNALLTLRHIRQLRRAIFINRGKQSMGVRIFSGESVAVPPPLDGSQIVLLALRIGNVLELRAEPVPLDWSDQQIWTEFDFTMTHRAPEAAYRR